MAAYTFAQLEQLALRHGLSPADAQTAAAIALAESRGQPGAANPSGALGLWQIMASAHPEFVRSRLFEPDYNAWAMADLYRREGWAPWTTYKSGAYRPFLPSSSSSSSGPQATTNAGGLKLPGIGDVIGQVLPGGQLLGVPSNVAGDLASSIVGNVGKLLLGLLLGGAGLALAGYGIVRLTSDTPLSDAATRLASTAGTVATVAAV